MLPLLPFGQLASLVISSFTSIVAKLVLMVDKVRVSLVLLRHGPRSSQFQGEADNCLALLCKKCNTRRYASPP